MATETASAFDDAHPSGQLQFRQYDLNDDRLEKSITDCAGALCIYARFFLHAIDDHEEEQLLRVLSSACRPGDLLAVEYRTEMDIDTDKQAAPHFRRFIKPEHFEERAALAGCVKRYGIAGRGCAKY